MENNTVFNITICIIGILILLVHVVNLILKKNKRKDEIFLLIFIAFTVFHFAIYLTYTLIKMDYTNNPLVISFYTTFYIFNNLEVLLLFLYFLTYIFLPTDKKKILSIVNISLFSIIVLLDIINIFNKMFFYAEDGIYLRNKFMILAQMYQFVILGIVFVVAIINKKLNKREKMAFGLYCILPLIAIIVQDRFKGYAIAYASIIVAVEVLFFFVNVERNINIAKEGEMLKDAQIKLMTSQIQPHFIYNSLSSISTLIELDPKKAQEALDNFTEYLRRNLSSLTETNLIPFENELRHIKTYIALEKIRFNDRVNVVYDIETTDFRVPPLTIQPIVENAVKHGILEKLEGGTVTVKTYETDSSYVIEVIDDGIGFDINDVNFDENKHIGLKNIMYRINHTYNGKIEIDSKKNIGTTIRVSFVK